MKIKPIKWAAVGEGVMRWIEAETSLGLVRIYVPENGIDWPRPHKKTRRMVFSSREAAKTYVQEQHEARLRSFIEGCTDE